MSTLSRGLCVALFTLGCNAGGVGDPCIQESVPQDGYDSRETYIEQSSTECVTRVCLVHGLSGDPRDTCTEGCADETEVAEHVYCSCRCDDGASTPCDCPDGYVCYPTGALGSFCVRDAPDLDL